jgi:hypothetical protein
MLPLEPTEQLTLDLFSEGDDFAQQATETLWQTSKLLLLLWWLDVSG